MMFWLMRSLGWNAHIRELCLCEQLPGLESLHLIWRALKGANTYSNEALVGRNRLCWRSNTWIIPL